MWKCNLIHWVSCFAVSLLASVASSVEPQIRRFRAHPNAVAVSVTDGNLVHTAQFLAPRNAKTDDEQAAEVVRQLSETLTRFKAKPGDLVKVNAYVADAKGRIALNKLLAKWLGSVRPATSYVSTPLPGGHSRIGLDAIFVSPTAKVGRHPFLAEHSRTDKPKALQRAVAAVLPQSDTVYVSGQAAKGDLKSATRSTMEGLLRTLDFAKCSKDSIVQIKCFLQPMTQATLVRECIDESFPDALAPPIVYVQWQSGSAPIEIELIASRDATQGSENVDYLTPPWMSSSKVFSRVAVLRGPTRIYTSGLVASNNSVATTQIEATYSQLTSLLKQSGSDLRNLAKATYYVTDNRTSQALGALRPNYYDPLRPPAASKATVPLLPFHASSFTMDIIAAPARKSDSQGESRRNGQ